MNAITRRTSRGLSAPKLCFTLNSVPADVFNLLWTTFYSNSAYDKYWYYYDGKPLMLADRAQLASCDQSKLDKFTFRYSWAWMQGRNADQWAWLEYYPQKPGWTMKDGAKVIEQISVSTAQHATSKVGKSYHNGKQPALDKYGLCTETPQGLYFDEQWRQALEVDPPMVMVTQFNECVAQRFIIKTDAEKGNVRPAATPAIGESYFVDAYNAEFNRDIEPSTHPLIRDNYYMMLVDRVRRYKGVRPIPTPSAAKTIEQNGDMTQWADVQPEYRDDRGDVSHRSTKGFLNMASMTNTTGRTDLELSKVAADKDNIYFYMRTYNLLPQLADVTSWVMLFINKDCDYATGWNGYDFVCRKQGSDYMLMRYKGTGYEWEPVCKVTVNQNNSELHFALRRSDLGIDAKSDFDFKWADNIPDNPDILDFIDKGDVAPNGRFNYRFKGSAQTSAVEELAAEAAEFTAVRLPSGKVKVSWQGGDVRKVVVYAADGAVHSTRNVVGSDSEVVVAAPQGFAIVQVVTATGASRQLKLF